MTLQTRLETELIKYTNKINQEDSLYDDDELSTILRIVFPECIVIIYPEGEYVEVLEDMQEYVNRGHVKELAHDYVFVSDNYTNFSYPVLLIKEEK